LIDPPVDPFCYRSPRMARLGIFGGSFDPPHVGHVLGCAYLRAVHDLDGVLVVPVYRHPFAKELAPFEDRMRMCELAMGWIAGVEVSDIERRLGGESLTLRTVEALRAERGDAELRLVIGADVLGDLSKWHRFDRIAELAPPIVLGRAGFAHPDAPLAVLPEVSSTEVRALVRAGREAEIAPLVPAAVRRHLAARALYRA
jgi:nicotinate-nucleotide adenylyltransferase